MNILRALIVLSAFWLHFTVAGFTAEEGSIEWPPEVLQHIRQMQRALPPSIREDVQKGNEADLAGNLDDAIRLIERAKQVAPDAAYLHFYLATLYFKKDGTCRRAMAEYRQM